MKNKNKPVLITCFHLLRPNEGVFSCHSLQRRRLQIFTTDDADFSKLNALEEYSFLSPKPTKVRKPYPAKVPSNIHIDSV